MNLIKLNKNIIIREEDKMIFSANDMKIYKFNNKYKSDLCLLVN